MHRVQSIQDRAPLDKARIIRYKGLLDCSFTVQQSIYSAFSLLESRAQILPGTVVQLRCPSPKQHKQRDEASYSHLGLILLLGR